MSMRAKILLVLLCPLALCGALLALGLTLPVPYLGRDYVLTLRLPDTHGAEDLPPVQGPMDRSRPLVVIDAGHGGRDPGASAGGIEEKRLVLALAQALRDRLLEEGGVRVAMTRDDDSFRILSERPEVARRLDADLFISIHADSSAEDSPVQGASIYTLSSKASSEAAARFAERENDADRLNGVDVADTDSEVSSILVELSQRRVQEKSEEFARLIMREGEGRLQFNPQPRRSAALAVLRAPDLPAVLYEAGFLTDPSDAARLVSPEGRRRFADTMARAIRIYFARQTPVG
ncbi:N-acetylmuramoyl-L-alanine amidase [Erythrobacter sp. 3-20A1M]|nr:N-acetylmuramoyl-L-alanine amidase [Erythrobacter sp. 3-20A1M]QWC55737.1 N-acetylmuramoyl-L-alanine amidase [Erythrobacter sp. 3-20A1M]